MGQSGEVRPERKGGGGGDVETGFYNSVCAGVLGILSRGYGLTGGRRYVRSALGHKIPVTAGTVDSKSTLCGLYQ